MINCTVSMAILPGGYDYDPVQLVKLQNSVPFDSFNSLGFENHFVDTIVEQTYFYINEVAYDWSDLKSPNVNIDVEGVGLSAIGNISTDNNVPLGSLDLAVLSNDLYMAASDLFQISKMLPSEVRLDLYNKVMLSQEGAIVFTPRDEFDICSIQLMPDASIPLEFTVLIENGILRLGHLSYIFDNGEGKRQYNYLYSDEILTESDLDRLIDLIPGCDNVQESGCEDITILVTGDDGICRLRNYEGNKAWDSYVYEAVEDLTAYFNCE